MTGPSPFAVLGLPASLGLPGSTELTDDDVRAAWRRVAAASRPWRLALRALAVAAACYLAVAAAGWQPASAAVMTGALTWLLRTGRADLGPRGPYSS